MGPCRLPLGNVPPGLLSDILDLAFRQEVAALLAKRINHRDDQRHSQSAARRVGPTGQGLPSRQPTRQLPSHADRRPATWPVRRLRHAQQLDPLSPAPLSPNHDERHRIHRQSEMADSSCSPRAILSMVDTSFSAERIQTAYDVAAKDYHAAFGNDLVNLSLDKGMLGACRDAAGAGVILDVGCGTGAAGSYLASLGGRVVGVDLSLGMLKAGPSTHPLFKCQGDMRLLPFREDTFAAAAAFYSIQHVPRSHLSIVLAEIRRVLTVGGALLLAAHLGEGEIYSEEFLGHAIRSTGGTLYQPQEIIDEMTSAGFSVERREVRGPLAHEHQSQRVYLLVKLIASHAGWQRGPH